MKVRAHRGLPVNEVADECAAKGHTLVISLGEDREMELDEDLHFTKLTSAGSCSDNPAEVNMRWSKALYSAGWRQMRHGWWLESL